MRLGLVGILLIGFASVAMGQADTSASINEMLTQPRAGNDYIEKALRRSSALKKKGDTKQALEVLYRAQKVADSLGNASLIQEVHIGIADTYLIRAQYNDAEQLLSQTIQAYPQGEKKPTLINLLGDAYRYKGQFKKALEQHRQAEALVDSVQDSQLLGDISMSKGLTYSSLGDQGAALQYAQKAISIAEAVADSSLLAISYNSVGLIYYNQSELEKAKYYFSQAIDFCEQIDHQVKRLWALMNLALVNGDLGHYDEALAQHKKSLVLYREIHGDTTPYQIFHNMGNVFRNKGELARAEEYYRRSLDYCQKAGIIQGLIYNFSGLGSVAKARQQLGQATTYFEKALDAARRIGAASLEKQQLQSLAELAQERQDYQQALDYYRKFTTLSDSLQQRERERELQRTETKLGLRKQERINQLLQDKQQQQQARISTQNWLIAAGVAIIVIILISLYLLYRSYIQKQRINDKLEARQQELQELSNVKDKMLAILTHDLRSPMASIKGMLYLLRETNLSEQEVQERAADLELAIDQNISMMDNLLAWAREQMSGMKLDLESVNAADITNDIIENYSLQAQSKGIRLLNEVEDGLDVQADRNLLNLILRNLVSNAIKFSESGDSITISTREADGKVVFEVKDTGIGIHESEQDELFLFNGDSRRGTENEKGTGLGLQLCKEFVEKQGGQINMESTQGEGTTFIFELPKAS